jgi:hypothetical protein
MGRVADRCFVSGRGIIGGDSVRSLLYVHLVSKISWTAEFEFKFNVILATLVRSLEFRDTAAVVQQKILLTL